MRNSPCCGVATVFLSFSMCFAHADMNSVTDFCVVFLCRKNLVTTMRSDDCSLDLTSERWWDGHHLAHQRATAKNRRSPQPHQENRIYMIRGSSHKAWKRAKAHRMLRLGAQ